MHGHAVILAAALAWFISSDIAEAKLDILVDKATQRMLVIQDGYVRYMWPVSTGRSGWSESGFLPRIMIRRCHFRSFSIMATRSMAATRSIDLGGPRRMDA